MVTIKLQEIEIGEIEWKLSASSSALINTLSDIDRAAVLEMIRLRVKGHLRLIVASLLLEPVVCVQFLAKVSTHELLLTEELLGTHFKEFEEQTKH